MPVTTINWTASRIKALREDLGDTQTQFAQRLGVSIGAIRKWEGGERAPGGSTQTLLDQLAEAQGFRS